MYPNPTSTEKNAEEHKVPKLQNLSLPVRSWRDAEIDRDGNKLIDNEELYRWNGERNLFERGRHLAWALGERSEEELAQVVRGLSDKHLASVLKKLIESGSSEVAGRVFEALITAASDRAVDVLMKHMSQRRTTASLGKWEGIPVRLEIAEISSEEGAYNLLKTVPPSIRKPLLEQIRETDPKFELRVLRQFADDCTIRK